MADTTDNAAVDTRVMKVIATALQELGGATEAVRHGDHDILPALVESAYALVLKEEAGYDRDRIADFLGISPGAVESVFAAPMEAHLARTHYREDKAPEFSPHTDPDWEGQPASQRREIEFLAGSVAKFAYDIVNRQQSPLPRRH